MLQSACNIAYDIPGLRKLPSYYRKNTPTSNAGFIGDYSLFTGGAGDIDVGMMGLADFSRLHHNNPKNDILIAFRGTSLSVIDWLNDCKANQVDSPFSNGKVHHGFLESVNNLKNPMLEELDKLLLEHPGADIYVTGHSKGGAMAALMGLAIHNKNKMLLDRIKVVTFGAPRVGDKDFCTGYPLEHLRYESFFDIIPHLPFSEQEVSMLSESSHQFIMNPIIHGFHLLPHYDHVGKRHAFRRMKDKPYMYFKHHKHHDHPVGVYHGDNDELDTLSSLQAIISAINIITPKNTIKHIVDVHVFDYDHIPDDV